MTTELKTKARAVEQRLRMHQSAGTTLEAADTIAALLAALEAAERDVALLRTELRYAAIATRGPKT